MKRDMKGKRKMKGGKELIRKGKLSRILGPS